MDYAGKSVFVLDGYGRQIPIILQQLHAEKCSVTTLNCSKLDVGYTSRYPKRRIVSPGSRDNAEILKAILDQEIFSGKYDYVLPMLEPATNVLLSNEDRYRNYTRIMAAPFQSFMQAYNKQNTMITCMNENIPCPITKTDQEDLGDFVKRVGFPIVIKPRVGSGSIGLHIVKDWTGLNKILPSIRVEDNVIQEYIPQNGKQFLGYFIYDRNCHLKTGVLAEKVRWYPIDGGTASFLESVEDNEIMRQCVALLNRINWVGVAHIDLILDPRDGKTKVMEINGRMPASIKILDCEGIPFVRQLLDCYSGVTVTDYSEVSKPGLRVRYMQLDAMWLIKSPDRFRTKPSWFDFSRSSDMVFSWRDPIPFFSYSLSHMLSYKKDMEQRKR